MTLQSVLYYRQIIWAIMIVNIITFEMAVLSPPKKIHATLPTTTLIRVNGLLVNSITYPVASDISIPEFKC